MSAHAIPTSTGSAKGQHRVSTGSAQGQHVSYLSVQGQHRVRTGSARVIRASIGAGCSASPRVHVCPRVCMRSTLPNRCIYAGIHNTHARARTHTHTHTPSVFAVHFHFKLRRNQGVTDHFHIRAVFGVGVQGALNRTNHRAPTREGTKARRSQGTHQLVAERRW